MGIKGASSKATPSESDALPADKYANTTEPTFNYATMLECCNTYKGIPDQISLLQQISVAGIYTGIQTCM